MKRMGGLEAEKCQKPRNECHHHLFVDGKVIPYVNGMPIGRQSYNGQELLLVAIVSHIGPECLGSGEMIMGLSK